MVKERMKIEIKSATAMQTPDIPQKLMPYDITRFFDKYTIDPVPCNFREDRYIGRRGYRYGAVREVSHGGALSGRTQPNAWPVREGHRARPGFHQRG